MFWAFKSFSRIREHSALWIRIVWHVEKKMARFFVCQYGFLPNQSGHKSQQGRIFWLWPLPKQTGWLQGFVKTFLYYLQTCCEYVKASPGSGKHSARWVRCIRHRKKMARSKALLYEFFDFFQRLASFNHRIFQLTGMWLPESVD